MFTHVHKTVVPRASTTQPMRSNLPLNWNGSNRNVPSKPNGFALVEKATDIFVLLMGRKKEQTPNEKKARESKAQR